MKNGRWQFGDLGPDGRRFAGYVKRCLNGERWLDEDALLIRDAIMRLNSEMRVEDGSSAAYYAANTEKVKARKAAYRAANREKEKARHAAYRAANLEKVKAKDAAYRAANPDKVNAIRARYRATKIAATTETANHGIIATFYATAKRLSDVTGIPFEVDHIIPLQALGGGGKHCHTNLRILPQAVNRKRNSPSYVEPSCWAVPHPA